MLTRILLGVLLIVLACLSPVAAAPLPTGPVEASAARVWPDKAEWIGQKAVFLPVKMHQNVSFLFLYRQPSVASSGVDQLSLGRSLVGKVFFIKGLYQLKKNAASEYYWYLVANTGNDSVWVRDSKNRLLSDQPFALEAEFVQEKRGIAELAGLSGHTLWNNRNSANPGHDWADHLAPLTVREFRSDGPFSENYQLLLTKEDGTTVVWKAGLGTTPPAYNHQQFYDLLQQNFYLKSPFDAHPNWPEARWTAIRARKAVVGMDQEMAALSWGAAKQVTKAKAGSEIWEYPDRRYLFFKDKLLIKIMVPNPQAVQDAKALPNPSKDPYSGLVEVLEAGPVEKPATQDIQQEKKR